MPAKKRLSPSPSIPKSSARRRSLDEEPPIIVRLAQPKKGKKKSSKKKVANKATKQPTANRMSLEEEPPIIVRLAGPQAAFADEEPPIIVRGGSLAVELGDLDFEQIRVPKQPSKVVQTLTQPVRQLVLEDENGVRTFYPLRSNQGCIVCISYTDPKAPLDLPVNITIRGKKIEVDVAPLSFDDFTLNQSGENKLDHPISNKEITDVTVIYPSGEIEHYPILHPACAVTFDTRATNTLRRITEQQE